MKPEQVKELVAADHNFVEQSKAYAERICKVLKLDWKWPASNFLYLADVIQEAMFHVQDKYRKAALEQAEREATGQGGAPTAKQFKELEAEMGELAAKIVNTLNYWHGNNWDAKGYMRESLMQVALAAPRPEASTREFIELISAWRSKHGGPWLETDPVELFSLLNEIENDGFEMAHELRHCGHSRGDYRDAGYVRGKPETYTGSEKCIGCEREAALAAQPEPRATHAVRDDDPHVVYVKQEKP